MEVRSDSRLYRVAYWWREHLDFHPPRTQTNLCGFFWSVVAGVTVGPIIVALVWLVIFFIVALCTIFGFFFGYRPNFRDESGEYRGRYYDKDQFMIPIRTIPVWRGSQVKPVYVIGLVGAAWGLVLATRWFASSGAWQSVITWLLFVALGAALAALTRAFFKSEAWVLTKAFLKAKKAGLCPIITFTAPDAEQATVEQ